MFSATTCRTPAPRDKELPYQNGQTRLPPREKVHTFAKTAIRAGYPEADACGDRLKMAAASRQRSGKHVAHRIASLSNP
jgi:hypothetical protein